MQKSVAVLSIIASSLLTTAACAQQFQSVVEALSIKANASYTNPGWDAAKQIKGVKWRWPYNQSGAHDSTMVGKTKVGKDKNPHIGDTTVTIRGARTMIFEVEISVHNASVDMAALGPGKKTRLKTSCDKDGVSDRFALYRFDRSGYLPLYVINSVSYGASGKIGVETLKVFLSQDEALQSETPNCVIKR